MEEGGQVKEEEKPMECCQEKPEKTFTSAVARERFLRLLLAADNKRATFRMYENTNVQGVFQCTNASFDTIAVSELQTPIALYETATLRTSDVLTITLSGMFDQE